MGGKMARLSSSEQEHDAADSAAGVSGLSPRDINHVQHSWANIYSNAEGNGLELIKRFLRADPDAKSQHKVYRLLDEEQLAKSAQFRAHVISFMSNVNMVLTHLNQTEVAVALLNNIGESLRHLPKKHFESLEKVAQEYLAKDHKTSETVLRSWRKVMQFMYQHLHNNQSKS